MRRDFHARVVVVTGAGSGIGAALARRFAAAGAHVVLLDRDEHAAAQVAGTIVDARGRVVARRCDVTSEDDCRAAIGEVIREFGGIDVLVNNAGITHRSCFAETDAAVFRRVLDVNVFGALYCTQAALASIVERRGLVVVTSSIAGLAPLYERSGYAASKHALHGMFESLRAELSGTGVDVLIVCPGFTRTGIGAAALDAHGRAALHPRSTIGRIADPDSVAAAVFTAAQRGRRLLVLTAVGKLTMLLHALAPALYEKLMTRSIRREIARAAAHEPLGRGTSPAGA